jgi:hypothetical protein
LDYEGSKQANTDQPEGLLWDLTVAFVDELLVVDHVLLFDR